MVARELLGCLLVRVLAGERLVVRLVETEAYLGAADRASHAWNGRRTARNGSLYLPPGHAYVYFVYGLHHCLNVVASDEPSGGAVLLRAAEVIEGESTIRRLRGEPRRPVARLLAGPALLCQGLGVDRRLDGVRYGAGPLTLLAAEREPGAIGTSPRIGIDYAGEAAAWPLRFTLSESPALSRPARGVQRGRRVDVER